MTHCICDIQNRGIVSQAGAKAANLRLLKRYGFNIPDTWCCLFEVHDLFKRDPVAAESAVKAELASLILPSAHYAVRSAANVEDTHGTSFAGQFESFLSVVGVDEVWDKITGVYRSIESKRLLGYLERTHIDPNEIRMSVLIQRMIEPVLSGVAFSRHPITGLDEVVLEALPGSGEAILQNGADPMSWLYKWGALKESPEDSSWNGVVCEVAEEAREIERKFGHPVDIEWIYDGSRIYIVQARPMRIDPSLNFYSNRIAKEVLPGVIKPIVWSVNIPLINHSWIRLIERLIGSTGLIPDDLSKKFYHRAYFNMKKMGLIIERIGLPAESLEIMMGVEGGDQRPSMRPSLKALRFLPRIIVFLISLIGYQLRIEHSLRRSEKRHNEIVRKSQKSLEAGDVVDLITELKAVHSRLSVFNIVVPILSSAFTMVLTRKAESMGVEYESLNLTSDEALDFNPAPAIENLSRIFHELPGDTQQQVIAQGMGALDAVPGTGDFKPALEKFMDQYGHMSDSGNDFSHASWHEQPDLVLRMIADAPSQKTESRQGDWVETPRALKGPAKRAKRLQLLRDKVSFRFTKGYAHFRSLYLLLGEKLTEAGKLRDPEDVMYLMDNELRSIIGDTIAPIDWYDVITERKADIDRNLDVDPPDVIYGDAEPAVNRNVSDPDVLKGIGTSRGIYEGTARVIRSISQYVETRDGEVVIIPYSDVSWTPLFGKAGAVISESGGMLSHSSIIAREYGIPCAVAVKGAMRIKTGSRVSVDGYSGIVAIIGAPS